MSQFAKDLKKQNNKWSVQKKGKNKGRPWAAKQISMFLVRLRKPNTKISNTSTTKGQNKQHEERDGNRDGSVKGGKTKPPRAHAQGLGGTTWSATAHASALAHKKPRVFLPLTPSDNDRKNPVKKHGKAIGRKSPVKKHGKAIGRRQMG